MSPTYSSSSTLRNSQTTMPSKKFLTSFRVRFYARIKGYLRQHLLQQILEYFSAGHALIKQMEREMCQYLEQELNVDPVTLREFEDMVKKDFTTPPPTTNPFLPPPAAFAPTPSYGHRYTLPQKANFPLYSAGPTISHTLPPAATLTVCACHVWPYGES
ncbi:uncharacterized protein EDB93DRAFT_1250185 [Suillus bovinus]|uniref:uncharacterized protein n=1 Tax=Suillus bovinus TaxID=48563 RepID=UPI001B8772B0|nr:uncharacterized protein EDB93DRAFT_1250185 [Suillus bovinus]KAG2148750.1 hypothetical protein EDB93DRAFT_1250185 [Suillus bovinus]